MARVTRTILLPSWITPEAFRRAAGPIVLAAAEAMARQMLAAAALRGDTARETPKVRERHGGAPGTAAAEILAEALLARPKRRSRRKGGRRPPVDVVLDWLQRGKGAGVRLERPRRNPIANEAAKAFLIGRAIARGVAQRPLSMTGTAIRKRRRKARQIAQAALNAAADAAAKIAQQAMRQGAGAGPR